MPQHPAQVRIQGVPRRALRALVPALLALACCLALPGDRQALAQNAAQQPLVIATKDYPPLSNPEGTGRLDRLLREAFRRIGREIRFKTLPSQRALSDADAGVVDGDNNRVAGLEAKYHNLVRLDVENMVWEFVAFTKGEGVAVRSWGDLAGHTVGCIIGWKILEEKVRAASVVRVVSARQLFALLDAGRVDVAIYELHGGRELAKAMGLTGITAQRPPLTREKMYLYLNRKHAALVQPLENAMRSMREDGTYDSIFNEPGSH
ncbi:substrate-binding periplasmic protein [Fundidesulfovibrio agrisoli]|uniref:substrate-binding periplasmic protein n=1 Tax=Fundidesulfovibrio agrisoli TaxID=2922717 RepID=UPI001FAD25BB|nr:transporter substrate-binding domain-containing protein [Fundidesulfovibrio agrisoli]